MREAYRPVDPLLILPDVVGGVLWVDLRCPLGRVILQS